MKFTQTLDDEAVLREMGQRLAQIRLERNLTQAALAEQAGVSKRTVERLESGAVAIQFSGFIRICRALGLMERFELLLPDPAASPMAQLKNQSRKRKRASRRDETSSESSTWTWGDTP